MFLSCLHHISVVREFQRQDRELLDQQNCAFRNHLLIAILLTCVLRCVECPPVGADLIWANMVLGYEKLPETIKTQIAGLRARHSIEATFGAARWPTSGSETSGANEGD